VVLQSKKPCDQGRFRRADTSRRDTEDYGEKVEHPELAGGQQPYQRSDRQGKSDKKNLPVADAVSDNTAHEKVADNAHPAVYRQHVGGADIRNTQSDNMGNEMNGYGKDAVPETKQDT